jgi:hypothetical protein
VIEEQLVGASLDHSTRPRPRSFFERQAWSASERRYDEDAREECRIAWHRYHTEQAERALSSEASG